MSSRTSLAVALAAVVLLASLAATPVSGVRQAGGDAAVSAGPAPTINVTSTVIDDSTGSNVTVAYNATGVVPTSDLKLQVSVDGYLGSATDSTHNRFYRNVTGTSGTMNVSVPAGAFGGGNLTMRADLVDTAATTGNPIVANDTAPLTVTSPAYVSGYTNTSTDVVTGENVTLTPTVKNPDGSGTTVDYTVVAYTSAGERKASNRTFSVANGTSVTPALNVSFDRAGTYHVRVNDESPVTVTVADAINVTGYTVADRSVYTHQNVSVTATVTNNAGSSRTATIPLYANHSGYLARVASKSVTLAAGATGTVRLNYTATTDLDGVRVGSRPETSVAVSRTPVTIDAVTAAKTSLAQNEVTAVNGTLTNPSGAPVSYVATLRLDGRDAGVANVTLAAGETANVSFPVSFAVNGSHAAAVDYGGTAKLGVTSPDVDVDGYTINDTSPYNGEPVTVNATVNNTASGPRTFSVTAWAGDRRLDNRTVTLDAGATRQVSFPGLTLYSNDASVTVNDRPATSVSVRRAVQITDRDVSATEVRTGDTVWFNATLHNPTGASHRRYVSLWADGTDYGRSVTVAAGATKAVNYSTSFSSAGKHWAWFAGESVQVVALDGAAGDANLTVTRRYLPDRVVNDTDTYFLAQVENDGTAAGAENVTLVVDGTTVGYSNVYVPANGSAMAFADHRFTSRGTHTVTFAGNTASVDVGGPVVRDTHLEVVNGTTPRELPGVTASYSGGRLIATLNTSERAPANYNLTSLGVDDTTEFELTVTTNDFSPDVMVTNGHGANWSTAPGPTAGTTNVTVNATPGQFDLKTSFQNGRPTRPSEWDDYVVTDVANYTWTNALRVGFGAARVADVGADASAVEGLSVATDAQLFSMPTYHAGTDGSAPYLRIAIAAPHETANGNQNTGYYETFLPDSLLDAWGVTDPKRQLVGSYSESGDTSLSFENVSGGVRVSMSVHYSSGTVEIRKNTTATTDSGSSGTHEYHDYGSGSGGEDTTTTNEPSFPDALASGHADVDASGRATVTLAASGDDTGTVSAVGLSVPGASGGVSVSELRSPPADAPATAGTPVSVVDVSAPDPTDGPATVALTLNASRLPDDADPRALTVEHYTGGAWESLDTTVDVGDDTVTVTARTDGFSPFAVTYASAEQTSTTTRETTSTSTSSTTTSTSTTSGSSPGFGVALALLAFAGAALLGRRR